jgi:hypothetical protein
MEQPYDHAGSEPSLNEVFADPTVRAAMRRDGVSLEELCRVVRSAQSQLNLKPKCPMDGHP